MVKGYLVHRRKLHQRSPKAGRRRRVWRLAQSGDGGWVFFESRLLRAFRAPNGGDVSADTVVSVLGTQGLDPATRGLKSPPVELIVPPKLQWT